LLLPGFLDHGEELGVDAGDDVGGSDGGRVQRGKVRQAKLGPGRVLEVDTDQFLFDEDEQGACSISSCKISNSNITQIFNSKPNQSIYHIIFHSIYQFKYKSMRAALLRERSKHNHRSLLIKIKKKN
jgi:hypothetical protein